MLTVIIFGQRTMIECRYQLLWVYVNHHALLPFLAIKNDRGYDYVLLEERLYSAI